MTRPRNSFGTIAWISVFDEAISTIIDAPTGISSSADSQKIRDEENAISARPNEPDATATHRPRPRTPLRRTSDSAPPSAPSPDAPMSSPRPRAPPCKMFSANTGINTEYGIPAKLITPSRMRSARTGAVRMTNWKPSIVSRHADSRTRGRGRCGTSIISSPAITAM